MQLGFFKLYITFWCDQLLGPSIKAQLYAGKKLLSRVIAFQSGGNGSRKLNPNPIVYL